MSEIQSAENRRRALSSEVQPSPEQNEPSLKAEEKKSFPSYDLSTVMGFKVEEIPVSDDVAQMSQQQMDILAEAGADSAELAEIAWSLRLDMLDELKKIKDLGKDNKTADRAKTFKLRQEALAEDEDLAMSLSLYHKLLSQEKVAEKLTEGLHLHAQERKQINGTWEEYMTASKELKKTRGQLSELTAKMFRRRGNEVRPAHLLKRMLLEANIEKQEYLVGEIKERNPETAALIEYNTIKDYATDMEATGFAWAESRRDIMDETLSKSLSDRPVVALLGETGTGKTALARALSMELTGREPERTVGGSDEKFVRLLASSAIRKEKSYYEYGPLLRAMTGKTSSLDENPKEYGSVFFDDEFNTRPTAVQRQILKFVSEARPGRKMAVPGTPLTEEVKPGFLYVAAGNPASERYEREETGLETKREFGGSEIEVDYLEQTIDNPELYYIMLAALLDKKTKRLTAASRQEIQPNWLKDSSSGQYRLDDDPTAGGFVWRFANAWKEMYNGFSKKSTVLNRQNPAEPENKYYLNSFIIDTGALISWLKEYKANPQARREHIENFFQEKLRDFLKQFDVEEQNIVTEYLRYFNIDIDKTEKLAKPKMENLTPKQIGQLSPNAPRTPEEGEITPAETFEAIGENGEVLEYFKNNYYLLVPGIILQKKTDKTNGMPAELTFLGVLKQAKDEQPEAVCQDGVGNNLSLEIERILENYEIKKPEGVILKIKNAKNPYREAMIDGGVSPETIPETEDISLNLTEHLQNDIARYESSGLLGWVADLRKIENRLKTLSAEKRKTIEQEIQAGAIPIFMPGKKAQAQSQIVEIANKLKPHWIKDNQPEQVNDAYVWDYIVSLGEKLTEDAPKNPYILLTQPTQKPQAETVNKTVIQQLEELKKINKARQKKGKESAQAMVPYEYIVFQKKFTEQLANNDKGKFGKSGLREIKPLDYNTYTRFISLPLSSAGNAPCGYFGSDSVYRQLRLDGSGAGLTYSLSGCRLSVRVEI